LLPDSSIWQGVAILVMLNGHRDCRIVFFFISGLPDEKMVASVLWIKFEGIMFVKAVETTAVVEQARKDVCVIIGEDLSGNAIAASRSHAHNSPIWVSISGTSFIPAACKQGIAGPAETTVLSGLWWFTILSELSISECSVSPMW